jgi:hypothetical protein
MGVSSLFVMHHEQFHPHCDRSSVANGKRQPRFGMNLRHPMKTFKVVKDTYRMRNLPVSSESSELLHLLEELWTTQICVCCASKETRIFPGHEIKHTTCTDSVTSHCPLLAEFCVTTEKGM